MHRAADRELERRELQRILARDARLDHVRLLREEEREGDEGDRLPREAQEGRALPLLLFLLGSRDDGRLLLVVLVGVRVRV